VYHPPSVDTSLIAALGLGFLLGLRHALDADHVAAVSTFVAQERGILRSCLRGTFWGIGHTIALLAAGVAVVVFKVQISPALERDVERVVGLALIGLGGHVLFRTLGAVRLHRHEHSHGGTAHSHVHVHVGDAVEHRHVHPWRAAPQPLLMGLLHGLAGSGALLLLVLAAMPSPLAAVLYVLVFGVGSTAGMLALSGLIGVPFALTAGGSRALSAVLRLVVGAASIVVGVSMLI
jgi:ABC-type nickel/cobalt efflux system permease component RcnA